MKKTKLGCSLLEGSDTADLVLISKNAEILENEILKDKQRLKDLENNLGNTTEEQIVQLKADIENKMGKLSELKTSDKASLVGAINENMEGITKLKKEKLSGIEVDEKIDLKTKNKVDKSTKITAGTGLTGGGTLENSISLGVQFGTGSNQVARGNHTHGDGINISMGDKELLYTDTNEEWNPWRPIDQGSNNSLAIVSIGHIGGLILIDYKAKKYHEIFRENIWIGKVRDLPYDNYFSDKGYRVIELDIDNGRLIARNRGQGGEIEIACTSF